MNKIAEKWKRFREWQKQPYRVAEKLQKRFDSGHAEKSIRMLQECKERFRQAVEAGSQSRR